MLLSFGNVLQSTITIFFFLNLDFWLVWLHWSVFLKWMSCWFRKWWANLWKGLVFQTCLEISRWNKEPNLGCTSYCSDSESVSINESLLGPWYGTFSCQTACWPSFQLHFFFFFFSQNRLFQSLFASESVVSFGVSDVSLVACGKCFSSQIICYAIMYWSV